MKPSRYRIAILSGVLAALLGTTLLALSSCSDTITSTYSSKYPVMCGFQVVAYAELFAVIDNTGEFATIRQSGGKIVMTHRGSSTSYTMDALSKEFLFGLGGLIVGTDNYGHYRAYDLACPNCDRAEHRLSLSDTGTAKCAKCGIQYNLNNDGALIDKGTGLYSKPRGLYQYPLTYDGMRVNIIN